MWDISQLLEMMNVTNAHCVMQDVAVADEDLLAHEEHLKYRYRQFLQTKEALEKAEGSLTEFAKVSTPQGTYASTFPTAVSTLHLTRPCERVAYSFLTITCLVARVHPMPK